MICGSKTLIKLSWEVKMNDFEAMWNYFYRFLFSVREPILLATVQYATFMEPLQTTQWEWKFVKVLSKDGEFFNGGLFEQGHFVHNTQKAIYNKNFIWAQSFIGFEWTLIFVPISISLLGVSSLTKSTFKRFFSCVIHLMSFKTKFVWQYLWAKSTL